MKALLGHSLSNGPRIQNFAMNAETYSWFLDWTKANTGKDRIVGGLDEKRNSVFVALSEKCGLGTGIRIAV